MAENGVSTGEVPEGSKRRVFLEMSSLINSAFEEIKGPRMQVSIERRDRGWKRVCVSFDASKIPFQNRNGAPDQDVSFAGAKLPTCEEADLDAVIRVADYLSSRFGLRFIDWNYEKAKIAANKICDVENSILATVGNIKSMVGNWKACLGLLMPTETILAASSNPFHLAVSKELLTLRCEVGAWIEHISDKIREADAEHALCSKGNNNNFAEDGINIKISERDIINDVLFSLGFKHAKFNNTLEDNFMFRGICKINLNCKDITRKTGRTNVYGDVKNTAYEAECSVAAKAISYMEKELGIEIVDLNYYTLQERLDSLHHLQTVAKKYVSIEQQVASEWMSMITQLKGLVNTQSDVFNQLGFDVDEEVQMQISQMIEEELGEINFLYHLSTMDLDQSSP